MVNTAMRDEGGSDGERRDERDERERDRRL